MSCCILRRAAEDAVTNDDLLWLFFVITKVLIVLGVGKMLFLLLESLETSKTLVLSKFVVNSLFRSDRFLVLPLELLGASRGKSSQTGAHSRDLSIWACGGVLQVAFKSILSARAGALCCQCLFFSSRLLLYSSSRCSRRHLQRRSPVLLGKHHDSADSVGGREMAAGDVVSTFPRHCGRLRLWFGFSCQSFRGLLLCFDCFPLRANFYIRPLVQSGG